MRKVSCQIIISVLHTISAVQLKIYIHIYYCIYIITIFVPREYFNETMKTLLLYYLIITM